MGDQMFEPWRGSDWGRPDNALGGVRLMLLGESHYGDAHEVGAQDPLMTQWVVRHYLNGGLASQAKGFFTKVAALLAGSTKAADGEELDREAIWSSVMFYNYVPVVVANSPGVRPTPEMWAGGQEPFLKVIEQNEVEAVLVLGKQLWDNMPPSDEPATTFDFEGSQKWVRRYLFHGRPERGLQRVIATHINHPSGSRGWTGARWLPVVDHLFDEVRRERESLKHVVGW